MKCFLSQINSCFHLVSGIFIRQYVNSSMKVLTKMAKIGTWRIITNLQYMQSCDKSLEVIWRFYEWKYETLVQQKSKSNHLQNENILR